MSDMVPSATLPVTGTGPGWSSGWRFWPSGPSP